MSGISRRPLAWVGFLLFCAVTGSEWIINSYLPSSLPTLVQQTLSFAVTAGLFGLVSATRKSPPATHPLGIVAWGGLLYSLLPLLFAGAGGKVSSLTEVLVFTLVPGAVVFAEAQRSSSFGEEKSPFHLLMPALVGLGGAALLLPAGVPASGAGKLWLLAMILSAGVSGWAIIQLHSLLKGAGLARAVALVSLGAAFAFGLFSVGFWKGAAFPDAHGLLVEAARILFLQAPLLLVSVWLLRELSPVRYTVRYLLVPLVAVIESYVLMGSGLSWTFGVGVLLVLAGSYWMLSADA